MGGPGIINFIIMELLGGAAPRKQTIKEGQSLELWYYN
jgi:hypothetical protein